MSFDHNLDIQECNVLKKRYIRPLCASSICGRIPSYYKGGKGEGCLIAHTLLSLYEYERIREKILSILARIVKRELKRKESVKEYDINTIYCLLDVTLTLTILLHDVGKLSTQYGKNRKFRHEVLSSIYAWLLLEEYYNRLNNSLKHIVNVLKLQNQVASSILLHHESFYWRELEELPTYIDLTHVVSRYIYKYKPLEYEMYKMFVEALLPNLIKYKLVSEETLKGIKLLNDVIMRVYNAWEDVNKIMSRIGESGEIRINNLVLPLYYILFLIDNRAASARDKYWEEIYVNNINTKGDYEALIKNIFKTGGSQILHVSIALLPL